MHRVFTILLTLFFFHLTIYTICSGATPQAPRKAIQPPQYMTSDETKVLVEQEIAENYRKIKESYDKQQIEAASQKLQVSEFYLKIAQGILSGIAWIAGVIGIFVVLFIAFGIKIVSRWFEDTIKRETTSAQEVATKMIEETKRSLENEINTIFLKANDSLLKANDSLQKCDLAGREILIANARFHNRMGYLQWELARVASEEQKKKLLEYAIRDTRMALELNPPNEELLAGIKSNLSYYYAEIQDYANKDDALKYATEARDKVGQYPARGIFWLANYAFVAARYSRTVEELDKVIEYMEWLRKEYPSIQDEIDNYLKEAREKKERLQHTESHRT